MNLDFSKLLFRTEISHNLYQCRFDLVDLTRNGEVLDYATKQWNGLVRDYYYPRWMMFFDDLTLTLTDPMHYPTYNQTQFEEAFMNQIGIPFTKSQKLYAEKPLWDPIEIALQTYWTWRSKVNPF